MSQLSVSTNGSIKIIKRNGEMQDISFDKIMYRIGALSRDLRVETTRLTQDVIGQLYNGISSSKIDELSANEAHHRVTIHPDYDILAARIAISNHQKNTIDEFSIVMLDLYENGLLNKEFHETVQRNAKKLDAMISYDKDGLLSYHGFNTFIRSYGLKIKGKVVERPQHMWLRVAVAIWGDNLERVKETYEWMSTKHFIHASPTLFNCGGKVQQLSSCFLISMKTEDEHPGDSIPKIFDTVKDCAMISKTSGGIGLSIHPIRASGSPIQTAGNDSNGIVPMLKVFEATARYVDQGRKRKGAMAIYIEPHHADIFDFIQLRKNTGSDELRTRDLHLALWIPDLFMKRVKANMKWSLMSPFECPGLHEVHSEEFERLYEQYEKEGKYVKQVDAQELFIAIISAQMETGEPYVLYKDHVNNKNNQSNLGTIRSSNLCVRGNTKILTRAGYKNINSLVDKNVEIWNGFEWSEVTPRKTGVDKKLIRVSLSNGAEIECTPEHHFYINTEYYAKDHRKACQDNNLTKCIEARNLKEGQKLMKHEFPIMKDELNHKNTFKSPYTHGFFCGDGMISNKVNGKRCGYKSIDNTNYCGRHQFYAQDDKNRNHEKCQAVSGDSKMIRLYGEKQKLLKHLDCYNSYNNNNDVTGTDVIVAVLNPLIEDKYVVPINESLETKLRWFAGYCDADGTIAKNGSNKSLQTSSIDKIFINNVRMMLSTMGVNSKVINGHPERLRELPDGKGGKKEYNCKKLYRLIISSSGLKTLIDLGFSTNRLDISNFEAPNRNAEQFVKVVEVVEVEGVHDTYCFTEKLLGLGTFNGIVTGQCSEIVEYSDNKRTAVCNLSSIALASFVKGGKNSKTNNVNIDEMMNNDSSENARTFEYGRAQSRSSSFESEDCEDEEKDKEPWFDFKELEFVTRIVTRNLNRVIDINHYPTPTTKFSNESERPMGIGVQGLADCFNRMRYAFDSPEAAKLNKEIFECIYYASVSESCEIAKKQGPYPSFEGSPMSKGKFQFDLWRERGYKVDLSGKWDWDTLRENVVKHGIRNSLLVALMPTASTSQLLGFNECFEPFTSNMYTRRTLAGSYKIVNKQLIFDLINEGLWSTEMKDKILYFDGSIQHIPEIPDKIKKLYKTSWDLSQKVIVDMAADRAPFIDQTQSMNIHIGVPNVEKIAALHFRTWEKGLKTGMYYLRTNPSHRAVQVTIDPRIAEQINKPKQVSQQQVPQQQAPQQKAPQQAPQQEAEKDDIDLSNKSDDDIINELPSLNNVDVKDVANWKPLTQEECFSCGS